MTKFFWFTLEKIASIKEATNLNTLLDVIYET